MPSYRSKTVATWLALLGGTLGLHRAYLHGLRDRWAWLHPWPTFVGLYGAWRLREIGLDDRLGTLLVPLLGLMLSQAMAVAIVWGLTPDERWDARHNGGTTSERKTGWGPVLAVVPALFIGGIALMGTIAFSVQKFFEWQLDGPSPVSARPTDQNSIKLRP